MPSTETVSNGHNDFSEAILNPSEQTSDGNDEDVCVLKTPTNSENNDCHPTSHSPEVNVSYPALVKSSLSVVKTEAEVTIVEYETFHPVEEESVVQAELVCQGKNSHKCKL